MKLANHELQSKMLISRSNPKMFKISRRSKIQIIDAMEKKSYKAKVEIIRQGQDGTQMFILEKGSVSVSKVNCQKSKFASYPRSNCRTLLRITYEDVK